MNTIYNLFLKLNKYKFSHPNYYHIWFNFLISQDPSINYDLILNNFNYLFYFLDNNEDISKMDILNIILVLQIINKFK